jgi:hypothetical protein
VRAVVVAVDLGVAGAVFAVVVVAALSVPKPRLGSRSMTLNVNLMVFVTALILAALRWLEGRRAEARARAVELTYLIRNSPCGGGGRSLRQICERVA